MAAFAQWLVGFPLPADVALLAALYTVAADRPRRVAAAGFFILECGAVLAAARWGASAMVTFASLSGAVMAALVAALYVRARRVAGQRLRRQIAPAVSMAPPPGTGCPFRHRCDRAGASCAALPPASVSGGRTVCCRRAGGRDGAAGRRIGGPCRDAAGRSAQ